MALKLTGNPDGEEMATNIDKITQLVRENPAITVKEIAKALGYSEERSVYYWLEKAKYKGIKDFKQTIFADPSSRYQSGNDKNRANGSGPRQAAHGGFARSQGRSGPQQGNGGPALIGLQIANGLRRDRPDAEPELAFYSNAELANLLEPLAMGHKAFAVVASPEYAPMGVPGEEFLFIVDPLAELTDGCLVLTKEAERFPVIRRYFTATEILLVHPFRQDVPPRYLGRAEAHREILGRVTHLMTSYA